jgi:hypothetical protein
MEQTQWRLIVQAINRICRSAGRLRRCRYSDSLILKFYFWAVKHDRPMTWAVDPLHATRLFRPRRRPSISQLNRRIASERFARLYARVLEQLRGSGEHGALFIDGRALLVSPVSQDRDARYGYIPCGTGRGYKLHAVVTRDARFTAFCVLPLNRHEMPVARELIAQMPSLRPGVRVFADSNYDAAALHKQIHARGGRLLTRPRGRARHPVTLRQMGPARRRLIALWDRHPAAMERLYRQRDHIERVFGHLAATPGLLGPLPAFVRGLKRVTRWVTAKIILYHARLDAKKHGLR